ncbi:zinc-binding alcohol dehydrogenase family protein [Aestuariivirga litoralis]|uniref:zinc-binding alcohol dehydrogenase family protein n=1 Tax=Aestuariivirga litoralis TaxID=2650924 RepID=UPI0018C7CBB6|nr:zinc-binding alcohol dehydrogenase family protein [Aestuariivirga litoralis]MBG1230759.1 zinc-binding alcohol dehydrogenase family protein [Aestuariivirga litoralis]
MRALVCRQPHDLGVETRALPVRKPGEAIVKLQRIGICGTDYHIYEGLHPFLQYPRVMGHELAATVIEADAGSKFSAGQLVAINPYIACGECHACKQGKPNCCMKIAVLGVHRDGGMAEYLALPEGNLLLADGMSADAAACVEFLAIGAHAVRRSELRSRQNALIVGAGPIGLGTGLFGAVAGGNVTIMDRDPARLALASWVTGITSTILSTGSVEQDVLNATQGNGFDVVFDATGNAASMEKSFGFVAHGGSYVMVGLVKDRISFFDPDFHKREMRLLASRNATAEDFALVMSSIQSGKIPVDALVTHRTSFDSAAANLASWARDKNGLIKAMIEMD